MRKKFLLGVMFVLVLTVAISSKVNAVPFSPEYSDNIQRYVIKSGTKANLINKTTIVKPNTSFNLDYKIGQKFTAATYKSSNKKVATVDAKNGVVKFVGIGKVSITVYGSDKRTHKTYFSVNDTYVTVSIKNQNAKLYINGKLKKKVPVVTGRAGVTPTPKGTFKIAYKQRDTYLDGATVGFDYYLPVKYWMPLGGTGGVGLHDASWRGYNQFGGNYYLWDGSHGCINMRTADAAYFFGKIKKGTTVKVY